MSEILLIDRLVQQVLHWGVGPDRFLTGNRSWIPRWKFNPLERLGDAFMLLDHSKSVRYVISGTGATFQVEVKDNGKIGRAVGESLPRAITLALARALEIEVEPDTLRRNCEP